VLPGQLAPLVDAFDLAFPAHWGEFYGSDAPLARAPAAVQKAPVKPLEGIRVLDDYENRGVPERVGNGEPRGAPLGVFRTTDGWVAMVMTSDDQWARVCELMERPELIERYTRMRDRAAKPDVVNGIAGDRISTRSTESVLRDLLKANDAEIARLRAEGALGPIGG